MKLRDVVLLAAPTARSQAYVQALAAAGLEPEAVILLGDEPAPPAVAAVAEPPGGFPLLPDLAEPVHATCARAGMRMLRVPVADVNAEATLEALREVPSRIVIYSGPAGQIVSPRVLQTGSRFLHLHSGWLPDYRGSTTLYYALLNGDAPAVTALYLDRCIDTGPVLARRTYPRPPAGLDLDRLYDPAIRADLLVRLMRDYARAGALPEPQVQRAEEGTTYYVIHPVLKHVALLSLHAGAARP